MSQHLIVSKKWNFNLPQIDKYYQSPSLLLPNSGRHLHTLSFLRRQLLSTPYLTYLSGLSLNVTLSKRPSLTLSPSKWYSLIVLTSLLHSMLQFLIICLMITCVLSGSPTRVWRNWIPDSSYEHPAEYLPYIVGAHICWMNEEIVSTCVS